jgi:hypothetical protein
LPEPERQPRNERIDLIGQSTVDVRDTWSTALTVNAGDQLREMVHLLERGLMSVDEFERQRRKIASGAIQLS